MDLEDRIQLYKKELEKREMYGNTFKERNNLNKKMSFLIIIVVIIFNIKNFNRINNKINVCHKKVKLKNITIKTINKINLNILCLFFKSYT